MVFSCSRFHGWHRHSEMAVRTRAVDLALSLAQEKLLPSFCNCCLESSHGGPGISNCVFFIFHLLRHKHSPMTLAVLQHSDRHVYSYTRQLHHWFHWPLILGHPSCFGLTPQGISMRLDVCLHFWPCLWGKFPSRVFLLGFPSSRSFGVVVMGSLGDVVMCCTSVLVAADTLAGFYAQSRHFRPSCLHPLNKQL